jgi:hypothetical protein
MGVGRDVELVVRRGLSKPNRERFPAITDFADALRAAAAGRLRETQWAATLAYAAGEVASHKSQGRSGRRTRGLLLAVGVIASISIAFVVGGEVNRRSSLAGARSPIESAMEIAGSDEAHDAQPAGTANAGLDAEAPDVRSAHASDAAEENEAIAPLPAAAAPRGRDKRPGNVRGTYPRGKPRPTTSASPLGPDDDATLPATEPSN